MLKKSILLLMLISFNLFFTGSPKASSPKKRAAGHLDDLNCQAAIKEAINDVDTHKRQAALRALIRLRMDLLEYENLQPRAVGTKYEVVTPWQPLWKPYSPVFLP